MQDGVSETEPCWDVLNLARGAPRGGGCQETVCDTPGGRGKMLLRFWGKRADLSTDSQCAAGVSRLSSRTLSDALLIVSPIPCPAPARRRRIRSRRRNDGSSSQRANPIDETNGTRLSGGDGRWLTANAADLSAHGSDLREERPQNKTSNTPEKHHCNPAVSFME